MLEMLLSECSREKWKKLNGNRWKMQKHNTKSSGNSTECIQTEFMFIHIQEASFVCICSTLLCLIMSHGNRFIYICENE